MQDTLFKGFGDFLLDIYLA